MNRISVIAHGSPGSIVRRFQEDPILAVELLHVLKQWKRWCELNKREGSLLYAPTVKALAAAGDEDAKTTLEANRRRRDFK